MQFAFLPFLTVSAGYFYLHQKLIDNRVKDSEYKNLNSKPGIIYKDIFEKNNKEMFNVKFIRENIITKTLSFFGYGDYELGLNHTSFDKTVHILTDNQFITYILKKNTKIKNIIQDLLNQDDYVVSVSFEKNKLIIACKTEKNKANEKTAHILTHYKNEIMELSNELEKEFSSLFENNTYKKELIKDKEKEKIINYISIFYTSVTIGLLIQMLFSWVINSSSDVLIYNIDKQIYINLFIFTFSTTSIISWFLSYKSKRRYTAIMGNLFAGAFFSIFAPILSYNGLNVMLDKSTPRIFEVQYSIYKTGSGKNTKRYFSIDRSRELTNNEQKHINLIRNYKINSFLYNDLNNKKNKTTYLTVKNGFFNNPYILEIEHVDLNKK